MREIEIGSRIIGENHPCYIIAEAGVNHNGSLNQALKLVDAAYGAGADAIKFQLYRPDEQVSHLTPTAGYQYRTTGAGKMLEMGQSYYLPWEKHGLIAQYCNKVGITYIASCFEPLAVEYLLKIGGPCIKIGSGEISNYPLLAACARSGLPILLSTGMCTLQDVAGSVEHIRRHGNNPLVLFQCVSNYPADPSTVNLRAMRNMAEVLGTLAGYSDHTLGMVAAIAAVALGACMIEKHFTLDKKLPGPDHAMSMNPVEFTGFINTIRLAEAALGDGVKRPHPDEAEISMLSRRSLVSSRVIEAGERLDDNNVTLKRPATGIDPRLWENVRGRTAKQTIPDDVPITWEMLE